jgi:hypothetical protein
MPQMCRSRPREHFADVAWKTNMSLELIKEVCNLHSQCTHLSDFAKRLSGLGPGEYEYKHLDFMS